MNSVILAFSSSGEGNGGGGFCSMGMRRKWWQEKSTMAKARVNMTLAGDFRSLWRSQRFGLTIDFPGGAPDPFPLCHVDRECATGFQIFQIGRASCRERAQFTE